MRYIWGIANTMRIGVKAREAQRQLARLPRAMSGNKPPHETNQHKGKGREVSPQRADRCCIFRGIRKTKMTTSFGFDPWRVKIAGDR